MNQKYYWALVLLVVILAAQTAMAQSLNKIGSRASHIDESSGLILERLNAEVQTLELNSEHSLGVRFSQDGQPNAAFNVTWEITQELLSGSDLQSAFFIEDGVSSGSEVVIATDENGVSQATFNTGNQASVYNITAVITLAQQGELAAIDLTQSYRVVVGIQASLKESTPENSLAVSFDNLCPQLQANVADLNLQQQALLDRCNEILQAISEGKGVEVSQALRQLSPEEVTVQSSVGNSFSNQQVANVATRMSAVRRGVQSLSFSNLMFAYDGQIIPLGYMLSSVFSANENDSDVPGGLLSNKWGVFANGNVSVGNRNATSREDGFEFDNFGLTVGADYRLRPNTFVGATIGFSKSEITIDESGGDMSANGYSLGAYGSHYLNDKFYIDGVINLGTNNFDMQRNIRYDLGGNSINRVAKSDTGGLQQGITVGGGYEYNEGALLITTYGRLSYTGVNIDGFTETGADELNMRIGKQSFDSLLSSIGAQLSYAHSARWGVLMPFIWFSWEHEYSGDSDTISAEFADDEFGSSFNINTDEQDANYFSSGQGVSAVLPRGMSVYIRMENIIGKDHYAITNISFGGRIELTF